MIKKVFLRAPYNYDVDQASDEAGFACDEPSLAQQQFKEETDINEIVRRFGLTGELPAGARMPTYGDFTGVFDYHSAMNAVLAAQETFMSLPADIRARFDNDPAKLVDFCSDEANREEAVKLGLVLPGAPQEAIQPASGGEVASPKAPE